jgi:uncharacterized protein
MARRLGAEEGADLFIVESAALLHDIADWKAVGGDETVGPAVASQILTAQGVPTEIVTQIAEIIATMSFKGAGVRTEMATLEGKVVQDADRLDAIGAVGIGRAFAYGGHKGRPMHDPAKKPVQHATKEQYLSDNGTTINHFYEKLLLLKDLMNTRSARRLAEGRHRFLEEFLLRFNEEWEGRL